RTGTHLFAQRGLAFLQRHESTGSQRPSARSFRKRRERQRAPPLPKKTPASAVWAASVVPCAMAGGTLVACFRLPQSARYSRGLAHHRRGQDPVGQLSGTRFTTHHATPGRGKIAGPSGGIVGVSPLDPPLVESVERGAGEVNANILLLRKPSGTVARGEQPARHPAVRAGGRDHHIDPDAPMCA